MVTEKFSGTVQNAWKYISLWKLIEAEQDAKYAQFLLIVKFSINSDEILSVGTEKKSRQHWSLKSLEKGIILRWIVEPKQASNMQGSSW